MQHSPTTSSVQRPSVTDQDDQIAPASPTGTTSPPAGSPVKSGLTGEALSEAIVRQIEFYFSDENLPRDAFLKKQLQKDETGRGFVSLDTIMSFNKIQKLTKDVDVVRNALAQSLVLVLSEDGASVRRKTPMDTPEERTVYVSYLPRTMTPDTCKLLFSQCGPIAKIDMPVEGGVSRGVAFIEFERAEAAQAAIQQLNNHDGIRVKPSGARPPTLDANAADKNKGKVEQVKKDTEPRKSVYEQSPVLSYQKAKTTPKKRDVVAYDWEGKAPAEGRPKLNLTPRKPAENGNADADSGVLPARQPRGPDGTRGFKAETRKIAV